MSTTGVLHAEHGLLGASFADDDAAVPVLDYGDVASERHALAASDKAGLCDASGLLVELVEGAAAHPFVSAAFAGGRLVCGGAGFGAVLSGDGATVAVPLVMRTGKDEFVMVDGSTRSEVLVAWLNFLGKVEQEGRAPFASVRLTDASGVHVPLVLCGTQAEEVLTDYVGGAADLPAPGSVCQVLLDGRLACICLRLPRVEGRYGSCYLLLVPPQHACVLWRSLLSFPSVTPIGRDALAWHLGRALPWLSAVETTDRLSLTAGDLRAWSLVRDDFDYVGARALAGQEG